MKLDNLTGAVQRAGSRPATIVFSVAAFVSPIIVVFAPMALTLVVFVAALVVVVLGRGRTGLHRIPRETVWLISGFLGVAVFSALWSLTPLVSLYKAGQLTFVFLVGLVLCGHAVALPDDQRPKIGLALTAGLGVAGLLLMGERLAGMPLYYLVKPGALVEDPPPYHALNRAATFMALCIFPALWFVYREKGLRAALLFLLAMLGVIFSLKSSAAKLAVFLGCLAGLLTMAAPRIFPAAAAVVLIVFSLVAPQIPGPVLESKRLSEFVYANQASAFHRLLIWRFTAERIAERPFLGWGLDTSRALPGGHGQARLDAKAPSQGEVMPLHPHNAALQIRLELGLPGLALALAVVAFAVLRARSSFRDRGALAAIVGVTAAATVVAFSSYGIWQTAWLCAVWLAISLALALMCASDTTGVSSPQPK